MTKILAVDDANRPIDETAGASGKEKRQDHRRRTLKEAKAIISEWSTIDCVIRDLSAGGALLRFGGPTALPPSFRLYITQEKTIMPVELLWQRGLSAGVAIVGPAQPAPHKW